MGLKEKLHSRSGEYSNIEDAFEDVHALIRTTTKATTQLALHFTNFTKGYNTTILSINENLEAYGRILEKLKKDIKTLESWADNMQRDLNTIRNTLSENIK